MGKTEKGAIYIKFRDYFHHMNIGSSGRNTDDRDVEKFLNFFYRNKSRKKIKKLCNEEKIKKI